MTEPVKPGPGRPPTLDAGTYRSVRLSAAAIAKATAIGGGNFSDGVRQAIEEAKAPVK